MRYGSLSNLLMDRDSKSHPASPEVGMGATILGWTDRNPATVVAVKGKNNREVHIQRDTAHRTDNNGMSDAQTYLYEPNPNAPVEVFTLRKNGRYVRKGETMNGCVLSIGERSKYYDYSF